MIGHQASSRLGDTQSRQYYYDHRGRADDQEVYTGGTLSETIEYAYDEPGWLVEEARASASGTSTASYGYDLGGNRTGRVVVQDHGTGSPVTTSTSYTIGTGNLVTAVDGVAVTWNAHGEIETDHRGQDILRDADGLEWGIRLPTGQVTHEITRDAWGLPLTIDPDGNPCTVDTRTHAWGPREGTGPVAGRDEDGLGVINVAIEGIELGRVSGGLFRAVATDKNGTLVLDGDALLGDPGAFGEGATRASSSAEHRAYAGLELLEGTGYQLPQHRLYDAELGRFASADPLGLAGGDHRFAYAGNDPVGFVDPSGLTRAPVMTDGRPVAVCGTASGTQYCHEGSVSRTLEGPGEDAAFMEATSINEMHALARRDEARENRREAIRETAAMMANVIAELNASQAEIDAAKSSLALAVEQAIIAETFEPGSVEGLEMSDSMDNAVAGATAERIAAMMAPLEAREATSSANAAMSHRDWRERRASRKPILLACMGCEPGIMDGDPEPAPYTVEVFAYRHSVSSLLGRLKNVFSAGLDHDVALAHGTGRALAQSGTMLFLSHRTIGVGVLATTGKNPLEAMNAVDGWVRRQQSEAVGEAVARTPSAKYPYAAGVAVAAALETLVGGEAARVAGAGGRLGSAGTGAFLEGVAGGKGLGFFADRSVTVSEKGPRLVENHLSQFGADAANAAMLGRVRDALANGTRLSGADASFYMHEASEATMMGRGLTYEAAHAAALGKYKVSPFSVYAPEVIQALPDQFNSNWRTFWGLQ